MPRSKLELEGGEQAARRVTAWWAWLYMQVGAVAEIKPLLVTHFAPNAFLIMICSLARDTTAKAKMLSAYLPNWA